MVIFSCFKSTEWLKFTALASHILYEKQMWFRFVVISWLHKKFICYSHFNPKYCKSVTVANKLVTRWCQ